MACENVGHSTAPETVTSPTIAPRPARREPRNIICPETAVQLPNILIPAIAALALIAPVCANAQDWSQPGYSAAFHACLTKAGHDGAAIVVCENAETPGQDDQLNTAYQRLHAILRPYQRDLLVKDERAWIAFRDAECAFQGSQLIGGPPGIEMQAWASQKADCMLRQTHDRVRTLEDDYQYAREGGAG